MSRRRKRPKGNIEELPSGALRVRVYTGTDPVSKRPHYLKETVPPGENAYAEAEKILTRFLHQVGEKRTPRTNASFNQLLDRYLEVLDVDSSTRRGYLTKINKHVRPVLGDTPIARIDAEVLDSFYAMLRRCRDHCSGRRRHDCRPLSDSSVRAIHWILSGAFQRAVRWKWLSENPTDRVKPPPMPRPNPQPPTAEEAARLVDTAFASDPDWGAFVWLAMTTGARRGELCALRWSNIDLSSGAITIRRALHIDDDGKLAEKDTKTHQQRRVVADPDTLAVLQDLRAAYTSRADELGLPQAKDAYLFSKDLEGRTCLVPDSVTQRYDRMAKRLGIKTTLHKLRHYSATELINAGLDVRTIAGRLGHGGGGATTLRVYTAWLSEADQRAAKNLAVRMPNRQAPAVNNASANPAKPAKAREPLGPYEKIAADLRGAITVGAIAPGDAIPTVKELAARYGVSFGTAHRAVSLLAEEGMVEVSRGRRAVVTGKQVTSL